MARLAAGAIAWCGPRERSARCAAGATFQHSRQQVNAIGVTWQLGQLDWSEVRADAHLEAAVRALEVGRGEAFARWLSIRTQSAPRSVDARHRRIARAQGVAIFIDYGLPRRQYYRAERNEGTLLCHYRHRFHDDPLFAVGVQDIGAWVDFTAVAEAASDGGLRVAGFATQAHFLIGCGIEHYLANLPDQLTVDRVQIARQAMVLTLPGEMGERFKVIGLAANYDHALRGFEHSGSGRESVSKRLLLKGAVS